MSEFWKKTGTILIAGVLGGALATTGGAIFDKDPACDLPDLSQIATKADIDALGLVVADTSADVITLQDEILAEDRWDATAEVFATEELEDDDYEELGEWILDEFSDTFTGNEDIEDLDLSVTVKDVKIVSSDVDDQDAIVEFDLKVRYEDNSGDRVRKYITATVEIDDGEAETPVFVEQ